MTVCLKFQRFFCGEQCKGSAQQQGQDIEAFSLGLEYTAFAVQDSISAGRISGRPPISRLSLDISMASKAPKSAPVQPWLNSCSECVVLIF